MICISQVRSGGRDETESTAGGDIYLPQHDTGGQGQLHHDIPVSGD